MTLLILVYLVDSSD